jgi:tetrapyrrole methylase family protein/MazG family protein
MTAQEEFQRFFDTIKALRAPNGCPWDKEQTPLSMRNDLIEEAFEVLDAISEQNPEHAKEELGDVILNATMISYMYEQENHFTVADVYKELTDKLIRRHPHVFPESEGQSCVEQKTSTPEEVLQQWDRIKSNLENRKSSSILDEVPNGFPPLLKAYKMQKKAAKKGFDWKDLKPVKDKIFEELNEVEQAYENLQQFKQEPSNAKPFTVNSSETANELQLHLEEEIGDLLFSVVNYARHLNVDPSVALNRTNQKFYKRFSYVEQEMTKANIPMDYEHLKEQDNFWNQAKDILK